MKKRILDIPSPITGGKLELCVDTAQTVFRGESVSYEKSFYHCVDSDLEYADEAMEAANLKNMYDAYRRIHGIPMAEELVEMRRRYCIPSRALSLILGLGENQFGLYEDGAVPTVSVGNLLKFAMDPANMKSMLISARPFFSEKEYSRYYAAIDASLHPAQYETESVGIADFGVFAPSFPASEKGRRTGKTASRRNHYNDYSYAYSC